VDGADDFVAAQGRDHPLDLPPVAKVRHIADISAALRPRRGLEPRVVAEALHEVGGIGQRDPAMDEWAVHAAAIRPRVFRD
jgi:hypothetical protein